MKYLPVAIPAALCLVFAVWGLVLEMKGLKANDQALGALIFGMWAVIRSGKL